MKKLIFMILAVLIVAPISGDASSQTLTRKGIKMGLNLANADGANVAGENDPIVGIAAGGFLTFTLNNQFAIQPEFFYSMKGFKTEMTEPGVTITSSVALNYLEFPLLGVLSFKDTTRLFAGPSIGFYLDGETQTSTKGERGGEIFDETETVKFASDVIKSLEMDLVFGASYSIGNMSLGARYSMGMTTFAEVPEGVAGIDVKNNVVQFMLGLSL